MRGLGGTYHNRSQRGSAECSSAESADEHRPKGVFGFAWALVMEVCSTVVNLLLGLRAMVGNVFYFFGGNRSFMRCQMGMEQAKTFEEWYQHAMEYCNYYGYYEWRLCTTDGLFNYAEIRHRTRGLRTLLAELEEADANRKPPSPGNRSFSKEEAAASDEVVRERFEHLLSHLRSDLIRGPCAINRPGAFTFSIGTKRVIEQYVQEIQRALTIVAHFDSVDLLSRYRYLNECLRNHGKTALLLSGGQSMSAYHLGVCRFLHSMRFLPRVICGAGAAAVVAAFVCCHTDAELNDKLDPSSGKLSFTAFLAKSRQGGFMARCARRMRRFCETGTLMDINVVADFVGGVLGDITFKEAYEKTGRVLNVVVSNLRECMTTLPQTHYTIPQPLLGSGETKWVANHLTAPDVLVRTAAVAAVSSGLFGSWLWKGYGLLRKNPTTGATESFAPCAYSGTTGQTAEAVAIDRLSEQFNVTCIIRARNKFRLFSNGAAAPVSPAFRASSLSRFVTRLETELKHEACYRYHIFSRLVCRGSRSTSPDRPRCTDNHSIGQFYAASGKGCT
ncbi:Lipase 5 [Diplonema papillatum]|nr:Lipase 5 [Diplonema papillatum]